ncbi:MAG: DUF805 domain-containing protein [Gloeobacteraceae cyanobacterium ES-bin-316]|nr:DUF805 domain-containing protein [Ferruginibacter sp.]
MIDWWKKVVLKNYANFTGRARRAEYWYFVLANVILVLPFYFVGMLGIGTDNSGLSILGISVYGVILLGTFVPTLAVSVRRLHDINRSGWFYFIGLIPLIGSIIILVWFFTDGNRFTNNYGADPKNTDEVEFDFERPDLAT